MSPARSSRILVGIDGTSTSERALHYAVGLAKRSAAELVVAHVRETWLAYQVMGFQSVIDGGAMAIDLSHELDEVASGHGVATMYLDLPSDGHVGADLARLARTYRVDAVVVGASQGLLHRFAGSTGVYLISHCPCPVTVVP